MSSPSTNEFKGRTALITGAGSGFGLAVSRQLAERGARIVAVDRNRDKLDAALTSLAPAGEGPHHALVADLRPADAARRVAEEAFAAAGQIDILVNSAGVCHFNRMAEITPEEWDEVLEIDLRSLFFLSVAVAERVNPARGARIINLGSNAGRKGRALSAHDAAAKAAVVNLSESLALTYGPRNITVNTVCPAVVTTPLWNEAFAELHRLTGKSAAELETTWGQSTPLRRLGTVDDVANLIVFLAGDRAAFITGQQINVCGGFMLTC
jgi:NAD(P)-dependent dehydrogenase (short-subunit alcohol dehydrogenase family)